MHACTYLYTRIYAHTQNVGILHSHHFPSTLHFPGIQVGYAHGRLCIQILRMQACIYTYPPLRLPWRQAQAVSTLFRAKNWVYTHICIYLMLAHVHILIQADDIIAVIHEADFPLLGPAPKASVKDYPRKYVSSSSLSTPSSSSSSSLSSPSAEAADAGLGPAE